MKEVRKEKLQYLKYSVFHPFDAFYEIRFRGKGSLPLAVAAIIFFGVLQCLRYQYTGFIINSNEVASMNALSIFATWVCGFVLFIFSNWSVTTLFSGKGNLADITGVVGYSLIPLELTMVIQLLLSNFIIKEEAMIVYVITGIGVVWFLFMLVAGLCVIHEYTFGKNIASIFLSFVAAAIILFIGILVFTLIEQMTTFAVGVAQELLRRMR